MRSKNFIDNKPLIYLVATPIGNLDEISPRALEIIKEADLIACEDTRVSGKLLSFFNISKPLVSLREHNETSESLNLIPKVKDGLKLVYMSDAGYPCISDPGSRLVKLALENDINVSVISGPNAALNALIASGLETTHFYFHGFLSAKENEQIKELNNLKDKEETLLFYESPHRISKTLKSLFKVFGDRKACIARELTKIHEEYIRDSLSNLVTLDPETLIGEMVIVVEGAKNNEKVYSDEELLALLNKKIKEGLSVKDSIKEVTKETGVNKNKIYDLNINQKR